MINFSGLLIVLFSVGSFNLLFGQNDQISCNKKTPFKRLEKKIDSVICIPKGHIITDLYHVNMDDKANKETLIEWFKDYPRTNSDTTFYSIYLDDGKGLRFYKTYSNLSPVFIDFKSRSPSVTLEDSVLNEVKYILGNALATVPEFKKGQITLEFEITAREYIKLYFTFSELRNTFILTTKELYYSSDAAGLDLKLEDTKIYNEQEGLDIESFDYLGFVHY